MARTISNMAGGKTASGKTTGRKIPSRKTSIAQRSIPKASRNHTEAKEQQYMENFTPWSALAGGALIGLAAAIYVIVLGRVTGISGIVGGLLQPVKTEVPIQLMFVAGIFIAPFVVALFSGPLAKPQVTGSIPVLLIAGLLVGIGSRLGGGCTSGHGICGNARLSPRSIIATIAFMGAGIAIVFVTRRLLGI